MSMAIYQVISGSNEMWPLAPPIRPLETLHNSLSLKQMNDFLDKVVSKISIAVSSPFRNVDDTLKIKLKQKLKTRAVSIVILLFVCYDFLHSTFVKLGDGRNNCFELKCFLQVLACQLICVKYFNAYFKPNSYTVPFNRLFLHLQLCTTQTLVDFFRPIPTSHRSTALHLSLPTSQCSTRLRRSRCYQMNIRCQF